MSAITSPLLGLAAVPVSEKTQFGGCPRPNRPNRPNLDGKVADFCGSQGGKNVEEAIRIHPNRPNLDGAAAEDSDDSDGLGLAGLPFSRPESGGKQPFPSADSDDSDDSDGGASENRIFAADPSPEPSRPLSPPPPLRRGAISDADVEALALALLAADERCPAVTITDRARALEYRRGDARRQLAIILRAGEAVAAYPSDEAERAEERARLDAYAAEREAVQ